MYARVVLGVGKALGCEKVSCLERCPRFRSVLIERGVPLCILLGLDTVYTHREMCERRG